MAETAYIVTQSFVAATKDGTREVFEGQYLAAKDPLVRTHSGFLRAASEHIEQMTAAPGEKRHVAEDRAPTRGVRRGTRNTKETDMAHDLPPEHEDSPASPFAPFQPGAGVVADDVQDKGSGVTEDEFKAPKGVEHSKDENQPTPAEANAEALEDLSKTKKGK